MSLRPGLDGMIHISKLAEGKRVENTEDFVARGDAVQVEVIGIDDKGRVNLKLLADDSALA